MSSKLNKFKGRVLAIDDEIQILKLIELILKGSGFEVVSTASPITALEFIDALDFDCIITDAIMPHMNGYDLVEAIRRHEKTKKTPIIMLTRKRTPIDVKQALAAGANSYIVKPIDDEILKQKVNEAIGTKEIPRSRAIEITLNGQQTEAELTFDGRILKLSDKGFLLLTSVEPTEDAPFSLSSSLLNEMGITAPTLKLIKSEKKSDLFETRFSFVGMSESDSKKIRAWIQNELLRREST